MHTSTDSIPLSWFARRAARLVEGVYLPSVKQAATVIGLFIEDRSDLA
jgi:hypothetical protein